MDQTFIYETEVVNVSEYAFDKEPFFAIILLFSMLIFYVAYSRRKQNDESEYINDYIVNYNVLGLPVEPNDCDPHPNKGILFNTDSDIGLIRSFLYCILAVSLFGVIILALYPLFRSPIGCVIL